jgi:hypothetical protein
MPEQGILASQDVATFFSLPQLRQKVLAKVRHESVTTQVNLGNEANRLALQLQ